MTLSSSEQFQVILGHMSRQELLNFIWVYDQYVQEVTSGKYGEDARPLNIEDFYKELYKAQLIK